MFSGVLHGVSPGISSVGVVVGQSGTLVLDRENWVTEEGLTLELPQAPDGRRLKVVNSTTSAIVTSSIGGATISGVARSTGAAITNVTSVRILPGQRAMFISNGGNWIAQGIERNVLSFAYNNNPLAPNTLNPDNASDLIHYLGGVGSFVNPATNGTITAAQSSIAGGYAGAVVLTDRVANPAAANQNAQPANQANSWVAWQFPLSFAPSGLLIQSNGNTNDYHLRSFELRYSNDLGSSLTSASPVATWTQGTAWANQTQITGLGLWFYFATPGMPSARRWAIRQTGVDSSGTNYPTCAEVKWFGDYEVVQ